MAGLILSTIAGFLAAWRIRRYLDSIDAPMGFTRWALTGSLSLLIAYLVGAAVDALGF